MGCMSSKPDKMKVRPVYQPLCDAPTATRIFTLWGPRVRPPDAPMEIELSQTQNIGETTALFAIRYNRGEAAESEGGTEALIINGHERHIPLRAARALRVIFDNTDIIRGLTDGWAAWIWMDCISINESDQAEADKQRRLEPFVHAIAKWTLDCTGPVPQIKLGTNAYQSGVLNFGGSGGDMLALEAMLDNASRLSNHVPGQVIWTAA